MGIFGAVTSLAGSLAGGIMTANANRKLREQMARQQQENTNWFNRRYNENGLQRASAQAMLNRISDDIKARNQVASGQQAVMGGTEASVAATKEANAKALAQAGSQALVQGDAVRQAQEEQYRKGLANYNTEANKLQAQSVANMAQAASQSIGGIGEFVDTTKFGKNINDKIG